MSRRFERFLDIVVNEGKETILLYVGDFNKDLLNIDVNREWLVFTESLGPTQLVTEPTRVIRANKPPSIFILTVPRRYFCCGSLLLLVLTVRTYTLVQLLC